MKTLSQSMGGYGRVAAIVGLGIALGLVIRQVAAEGVPNTDPVFYSGTLTDDGVAVAGTRDLELRLWTSASATRSPACTTDAAATVVAGGDFRFAVSDECLVVMRQQTELWAEVTVDGDSLGLRKVGAVPYALEADRAQSAASADVAMRLGTLRQADVLTAETDPSVNPLGKTVFNCTNGQIPKYNDGWSCQADAIGGGGGETDPTVNSLAKASLPCSDGQVAKFAGGAWTCGTDVDTDTDTQLNEGQVDAFVANNGYSTGPHTVDTTLTEQQVDVFIASNHSHTAEIAANSSIPGSECVTAGGAGDPIDICALTGVNIPSTGGRCVAQEIAAREWQLCAVPDGGGAVTCTMQCLRFTK